MEAKEDVTDVRMIVYESLLECEKGDTPPGIVGKNMLEKYAYLDKQQRKFMHCLFEGVIDKTITLDYVIDTVSKTPVKKMKKPVRCIIRMGAYQILFMNSVPDRAACNEAVLLAKKKHLGNLSGFINGVLRSICRLERNITYPDKNEYAVKHISVRYSMPELILDSLIEDYGENRTLQIMESMESDRPVYGRTQISKIKTGELVKSLNADEQVAVRPLKGMDGFVFDEMDSLGDIEQFNDGLFTIQDPSSQLVGLVAGYNKGDTVIDVCAAPGGKSMQAGDLLLSIDSNHAGRVIACDVSESKLERINENIGRLCLNNVETMLRDGRYDTPELHGMADVVLCDAPCSGLGIMGRKRDIKYSITPGDYESLESLQREIIKNAVPLLKKGGTFVYSTCTMRKGENELQMKYIQEEMGLETVDFYDDLPDQFKTDTAKHGYIQLFAGEKDTDGFFIAKFRMRA